MVNKKSSYPLYHEFKIMKIGNILFNTNVDDIINEEIEETKTLLNQVKNINEIIEI